MTNTKIETNNQESDNIKTTNDGGTQEIKAVSPHFRRVKEAEKVNEKRNQEFTKKVSPKPLKNLTAAAKELVRSCENLGTSR